MAAGAMAPAAAALSCSAGGALASTAGHRGILAPGHPARSMQPGTSLLSSCGAGDNGSTCNRLALTAIGQARRARRADGWHVVLTAGVPAAHARPAAVRGGEPRAHRARAAPAVVLSKSLTAVAQAGRDPAMGSVPRRLPGGGLVAYAGATW